MLGAGRALSEAYERLADVASQLLPGAERLCAFVAMRLREILRQRESPAAARRAREDDHEVPHRPSQAPHPD